MMDGSALREVIVRLNMSQVGLAKFLGYDDSMVRRWIADKHPVPIPVEMLLRVMVRYRLTPEKVIALTN
jgi:plasmid maintenance system antidote protein VapI